MPAPGPLRKGDARITSATSACGIELLALGLKLLAEGLIH